MMGKQVLDPGSEATQQDTGKGDTATTATARTTTTTTAATTADEDSSSLPERDERIRRGTVYLVSV